MNIPDAMPILSKGAHRTPSHGACIMEMVGFLAGEKWSDEPACTHLTLTRIAQRVNDDMTDANRHRLLPYIGRLMNTSDVPDLAIRQAIYEMAGIWVEPLGSDWLIKVLLGATQGGWFEIREVLDFQHRMATEFHRWVREKYLYHASLLVPGVNRAVAMGVLRRDRDRADQMVEIEDIILSKFDELLTKIETATGRQPVQVEDRIPELVALTHH